MREKAALKINSIKRSLELIEDVNQAISDSQEIGFELMQKRYHHLKRKYTEEILKLLADYRLPIHLQVA
ncbi:MAG: hypothetical protein AAF806_27605 [Bacteroidota bacterium]